MVGGGGRWHNYMSFHFKNSQLILSTIVASNREHDLKTKDFFLQSEKTLISHHYPEKTETYLLITVLALSPTFDPPIRLNCDSYKKICKHPVYFFFTDSLQIIKSKNKYLNYSCFCLLPLFLYQ